MSHSKFSKKQVKEEIESSGIKLSDNDNFYIHMGLVHILGPEGCFFLDKLLHKYLKEIEIQKVSITYFIYPAKELIQSPPHLSYYKQAKIRKKLINLEVIEVPKNRYGMWFKINQDGLTKLMAKAETKLSPFYRRLKEEGCFDE